MCRIFMGYISHIQEDHKFFELLKANQVSSKNTDINLDNYQFLEIETQFLRERSLLCFGKIHRIETQARDDFIRDRMLKQNNGKKLYQSHKQYIQMEKSILISDANFWVYFINHLLLIYSKVVLFYSTNGNSDKIKNKETEEKFIYLKELTPEILLNFQEETLLHIQRE